MRPLVGIATEEVGPAGLDLEVAYASASPWLRANFIAGLDGAVEIDGASGPLGGPADLKVFVALRAMSDVVLVGARTLETESYGPAWLNEPARRRRHERGLSELPVVAVVSGSAQLDPGGRLFAERRDDQPSPPRPIVITSAAAPASRVEQLRAVATVIVCGDG
ncbi:MAG TPA: dihydrofolate reductase family protein, partial [Acidimicrobiales bacterium]